jgi:hypothetical protein
MDVNDIEFYDGVNVFVSYSLRDSRITQGSLEKLRDAVKRLDNEIALYIDIFDNPKGYKSRYRLVMSSAHKFVMSQLGRADVVLSITEESSSPWVMKELDYARLKNIPIVKVDPETFCEHSARYDENVLHAIQKLRNVSRFIRLRKNVS